MCLGSRTGHLPETGIHVTIIARSTVFSLHSRSWRCLSLCMFPCPSPPSSRRYLPLLRVAPSVQQSVLLLVECVCFPPKATTFFLISLRRLYYVLFSYSSLTSFRFYFLVLLELWCSRTRYADISACSDHEFVIIFLCFLDHRNNNINITGGHS